MRVAVVQLGYEDAEPPAERLARVVDLVAGLAGHDLVLLPELWLPTGFGYRGWEALAEPLDGEFAEAMGALARRAGVVLHAGSFVERLPEAGADGRVLANTSLAFGPDGSRLAVYRKVHRFGFGAGEPVLMEAGREVVVVDLPLAGGAPVSGASAGEATSVWTGLSTCYDLRFPELYRRQVGLGAELFLVPAAWPAPRVAHWTLLGRARAVEDQALVVQCNTAGTHAGQEMGGRSQVVDPTGAVLAEAGTGPEVLSVEVDLAAVRQARDAFPVLADRRL
ncbi:MAG TPA: carbon-nitrogen family hydrolase [Dermatophilaceae bacterium]|nr:carbon-nitrogen family hydrolase [Dermatophilaceae bacterium]